MNMVNISSTAIIIDPNYPKSNRMNSSLKKYPFPKKYFWEVVLPPLPPLSLCAQQHSLIVLKSHKLLCEGRRIQYDDLIRDTCHTLRTMAKYTDRHSQITPKYMCKLGQKKTICWSITLPYILVLLQCVEQFHRFFPTPHGCIPVQLFSFLMI